VAQANEPSSNRTVLILKLVSSETIICEIEESNEPYRVINPFSFQIVPDMQIPDKFNIMMAPWVTGVPFFKVQIDPAKVFYGVEADPKITEFYLSMIQTIKIERKKEKMAKQKKSKLGYLQEDPYIRYSVFEDENENSGSITDTKKDESNEYKDMFKKRKRFDL